MKKLFKTTGVIILLLSILFIQSCKKEVSLPTLTTYTATLISFTTASSGGNVSGDGGAPILSRGICWNTSPEPTISNSKTAESAGLGIFQSNITQLSPNTLYYVRAYATNIAGTGYGNEISFTTSPIALTTITTTEITGITQTSAVSGGRITAFNGGTVTSRGVCWGTTANPTLDNNKTVDNPSTELFTCSINGLTGNTTYYVRAFATNSVGTAYGNQVTFKTSPVLPSLTTNPISSITTSSCISGGNISDDGGAPVTARGVCWNTSTIPTVANNKTTNGTGTGPFTSAVTGLVAGKTYYLRSYATSSAGTSYGAEISFATTATLPILTTKSVTAISQTTATSGGNVSNDGGSIVTSQGVCWSISENPTITDYKTSDALVSESFISSMTGLSASTTYYVRSYAINNVGVAYGNQITFTTLPSFVLESEYNDSKEYANLIFEGIPTDFSLNTSDDVDWFKIYVPLNKLMTFELVIPDNISGMWRIVTYFPTLVQGSVKNWTSTSSSVFPCNQAGYYYFKISLPPEWLFLYNESKVRLNITINNW